MPAQKFGQVSEMRTWRQSLAALDPRIVSLLLLVCATYFACFSLSFQTGLYEDDYLHARYLGWDWAAISGVIERTWEIWPQGRPLARTLALILVYLSNDLGELAALKVWSFILLSANACLTFVILRRVVPLPAAFVGGLMMVVFPCDAAKMEIIRALQLQPVMFLFLAATWLYLSGRRVLPYIFIGLSLFIYENVALLFYLVSFLQVPWKQGFLRETLSHWACLTLAILAVVLIRIQFGPGDLVELNPQLGQFNPLERSVIATVLGFLVNLKLLVLRPFTALVDVTIWSGVVMTLVGAGVYFWLRSRSGDVFGQPQSGRRLKINPFEWPAPIQLLLVGVLMVLAAYPLMITYERFPPIIEIGRRSSSHTAASFGTSVMTAAIFWQSVSFFSGQFRYRLVVFCAALYMALLAGFQVAVQQGLALGWQYQKQFWQSVLMETPDLKEGDLIIVQIKDPLPETPYIQSYGVYSNLVLPIIFDFEKGPGSKPARVIWADQLNDNRKYFPVRISPDNGITFNVPFERRQRSDMDGKVIWLIARNGQMQRVSGVKEINGVDVNLKPVPAPNRQTSLKQGPLYRYLME